LIEQLLDAELPPKTLSASPCQVDCADSPTLPSVNSNSTASCPLPGRVSVSTCTGQEGEQFRAPACIFSRGETQCLHSSLQPQQAPLQLPHRVHATQRRLCSPDHAQATPTPPLPSSRHTQRHAEPTSMMPCLGLLALHWTLSRLGSPAGHAASGIGVGLPCAADPAAAAPAADDPAGADPAADPSTTAAEGAAPSLPPAVPVGLCCSSPSGKGGDGAAVPCLGCCC